jgi:hypothetical protein
VSGTATTDVRGLVRRHGTARESDASVDVMVEVLPDDEAQR